MSSLQPGESPSEGGPRTMTMVLKLFYVCVCIYFFLRSPFRFSTSSYVNGASADAVLFILCPTQSYNLTVILLQHLIKINKCMSRREGVGVGAVAVAGS